MITPLCFACQLDRTEIAIKIIEAGADLNAPCSKGYYPLHYACEKGNMIILESLIDHGVNLNVIRGKDHLSAVYSATIHNYYEFLHKLLSFGTSPNIKHISGEYALHKAISSEKWNFVELLLKFGADAKIENKNNFSSYELLILRSSNLINENLLKEAILNLELDGKLVVYLFSACEKGNLKVL